MNKILSETRRKIRFKSARIIASWLLLASALTGIGYIAYEYTQTRYYVSSFEGNVTIYQGIRESLGPFKFSEPYFVSEIEVGSLSVFQQDLIERSISAESLEDAQRILDQLREAQNE